jgi:16S rRNA C967 or C1407 C5-methylase (RsmB/RsmF family)
VYSVCTITSAETLGLDEWVAENYPELIARPLEAAPWTPLGRGAILLPQDEGTDGMYILRLQVPGDEEVVKQ